MDRPGVNLASQHERVLGIQLARTLIVSTTLCRGHHQNEITEFDRQSTQKLCVLAITETSVPATAGLKDETHCGNGTSKDKQN